MMIIHYKTLLTCSPHSAVRCQVCVYLVIFNSQSERRGLFKQEQHRCGQ